MTKKRYFSLLVFVVLGFLILGCKSPKNEQSMEITDGEVYSENGLPKNQKVTLRTIFPVAGYGKEFFEYAVRTFEEKYPNVKIDVRWIDEGTNMYASIMRTLLQSGNEKEIYTFFPSFSNAIKKDLALAGKLEALDDLWNRNLFDSPNTKLEDIVLVDKREVFVGDKTYSIPTQTVIYGLYYNKRMFEENGWNENPKDWSEFITFSRKIKSVGIYPMVMAGKYPAYFTYGWGTIPFTVGGEEYRDALYNYLPDIYISEAYKSLLSKMEYYAKQGFFHPGTVSFDHTQSQMEFLQGKAAMITNATWIANEMKEVTPKDFNWGFMVFPGNDNANQKKVILSKGSSEYLIWKNKPEIEKRWAKEFLLWLYNLDIQRKIAESGGVPIRRDFIEDKTNLENISPSVVVALEKWKNEKDIVIINAAARARTISNAEMAKLEKKIQDGYVSIVSGTKDAATVAREINEQYMKGLRSE